jgi:hypothetical protein
MAAPEQRVVPDIYTVDNFTPQARDLDPSIRVLGNLELGIGSDQLDRGQFIHKYGEKVKRVDQGNVQPADQLSYLERWVRVQDPSNDKVIWQGQFKADRRYIEPNSKVAKGVQQLLAIGPIEQLRRMQINTSFWWNSTTSVYDELEWVPSINRRGADGSLQGNKGGGAPASTPGYGNDSTDNVWSYAEYLQYLIDHFLNRVGGPFWSLDDKTGTLANRIELVKLQSQQSALSIIRRLIEPNYGLEFSIVPTSVGYTINVFSLSNVESSFGTAFFPANENTEDLSPSVDAYVMSAEAEVSALQQHDRLEIQGERVESCFSVEPEDKALLWTYLDADLEKDYKAGSTAGGASVEDHDAARGADRYRYYLQAFGTPDDWDWQQGDATVVIDTQGYFVSTGALRQSSIRKTEKRLPLRVGGVYTTTADESLATDDYLPPFAIGEIPGQSQPVFLDKLSNADLAENLDLNVEACSIQVIENDWGLLTVFNANHMHGRNHWAGTPTPAASYLDPDNECLDYDDTLITLAAKTDQRLKVYQERPEGEQAQDGSKMVIDVPGARLLWIAPLTAVGIEKDKNISRSPGAGLVVRNDNESLHLIMAGAISSYLRDRFSFVIEYQGPLPDPELIGKIGVMGIAEGDIAGRAALITRLSYNFDSGEYVLKAGYA